MRDWKHRAKTDQERLVTSLALLKILMGGTSIHGPSLTSRNRGRESAVGGKADSHRSEQSCAFAPSRLPATHRACLVSSHCNGVGEYSIECHYATGGQRSGFYVSTC